MRCIVLSYFLSRLANLSIRSNTSLPATTSSFASSFAPTTTTSLTTTLQITTSAPPSPSTTTSAPVQTQSSQTDNGERNIGLAVGLPLGLLLIACLVFIFLLVWNLRRRKMAPVSEPSGIELHDTQISECA